MLTPVLKKNDKQARGIIWLLSIVVFVAVAALSKFKFNVHLGFDAHIFALINAVLNSMVSVLLVLALIAIKMRNFKLHRSLMLVAIVFSTLFLVSYICHHLFAGDTVYRGIHDNRYFTYIFILITHISLATIILPFILFTAYRALTGEYDKHKKLSKFTWPLWLYVSVTGVAVYWFISPFYVPAV
jgi:putative membrane protein